MMVEILMYIREQAVLLFALLVVMVLAVFAWNLYFFEKRRAADIEKAVAGEREFYRAVSGDEMNTYLLLSKENLELLYAGSNFEKMTGISPELLHSDIEVIKRLISPKTRRHVVRQLSEWDRKNGFSTELDYHVEGKKEMRRAQVSILPDKAGYLVTLRDITKDYRIRQALEEKFYQAQRESQTKTDFLSKMSHEIRTPMNGIIGMLSLARFNIRNIQEAEGYLDRAGDLSQFLLSLINDILDMSRIESGKMELEQAPFDLFALAGKLDSMFRGTAESKGIHWDIQMQDFDIRFIVGDELRLSQVIINFVSNALKFTPKDGSVTVTFRQMDKIEQNLHLMIRVRDTGKGIKPDFISKIFHPFEQEDASTAQHYGGSGLGMAIADNIIKMMNGEILVESELGKGTEFVVYVSFPIAEHPQNGTDLLFEIPAGKEEEKKEEFEDFTLEGVHILLAEDNDVNAEIAMEILGIEGAVVERACDGAEAVKMFMEAEPGIYHVILMDIQMPEMDGWEAAAKIRQSGKADADIPIFAMSANAFVEDKRHSLEVGMNGHISKPVDYDEVRRVVGESLRTL